VNAELLVRISGEIESFEFDFDELSIQQLSVLKLLILPVLELIFFQPNSSELCGVVGVIHK
jgi:hypothetical protein